MLQHSPISTRSRTRSTQDVPDNTVNLENTTPLISLTDTAEQSIAATTNNTDLQAEQIVAANNSIMVLPHDSLTFLQNELSSMRRLLERFSVEIAALREENQSLRQELQVARNHHTVSTPTFLPPPIINVAPENIHHFNIAGQSAIPGPSSSTMSAFPINTQPISTTRIVTTSTNPVNIAQPSIVPSVLNPSSTSNLHESTQPNQIPNIASVTTNQNLSNTSLSPLQQWLRANSYNSMNSQISTSNSQNHQHCQTLHPLPKFEGNPLKWPTFYSSFVETTAFFNYTNVQNHIRLRDSLTGDAYATVKSLLINPNNVQSIMEILEFFFGRPELILNAQLEEIRNMEEVQENQFKEFINFAIEIQNLFHFLETIKNSEHHLCNPTLLNEIINKIPMSKRTEWIKFSLSLFPYPTLRDLSNWLNSEAQLLSIVISNSRSISTEKRRINIVGDIDSNVEPKPNKDQYSDSKFKDETKKVNAENPTFNKEKNIDSISNNKSSEIFKDQKQCFLCKKRHYLYVCPIFRKKAIHEKWNIVKTNKIGFACLKNGHSISTCEWKKICGIRDCKKVHSRFLHFDEQLNNTQSVNGDGTDQEIHPSPTTNENSQVLNCNDGSKFFFKIIPIKVHANNRLFDIYAFIDEGSNTSLIDMNLASELGLKVDHSSNLEVKWFNGNTTVENYFRIDIEVSSCSNVNEKFELQNVKAVKNLDLPVQSFDASNLSSKYKFIENLNINYKDAKPKLLIGLKHSTIAFPKRAIEIDELVAVECKLGWFIYGKLNEELNHHYENVILSIRESSIDEVLHRIVEEYFELENGGLNFTESDENSRAMQILESSTKQISGIYETGLLWKNDTIELPNNFSMALKRLICIENKMKDDPIFAHKYEDNLMDYIKKGYARKLEEHEINSFNGRTWFLPHFAVFNNNKPNKFRIVFDAAAVESL